ncbi:uncharacterized protein [Aegilops tauschii subsp. strangulata]|uniref:uncharacterized protein n=1 Tax=Aegilops tauschii subsp. strangulata TaxID=200361 RepID=UPI003CC89814
MDVAVSCELCKVHCIYGFTAPESKGSTLVYKASDTELICQLSKCWIFLERYHYKNQLLIDYFGSLSAFSRHKKEKVDAHVW